MFTGALLTNSGQSYILAYAPTLILTALAFLIPGKAGIWNVGAQGQVYLGGISAALVAEFIVLPPGAWPFVAVVTACAAGALWALIPALLEVYRNASAIVTTIMMNLIGQPFASYLLLVVIASVVPQTHQTNATPQFSPSMIIPKIPGYDASLMVFVAILVAAGTMFFLHRTTLGYSIRATGLGPMSAEAKGINPGHVKIIAMVLGGVMAGLAGAGDIMSRGYYVDQFAEGWFGGEGFAGIAVALVAANNPIGSIFSAFFFSILVAGAPFIQAVGLPKELVWSMQGLIILFTAMPYLSAWLLKRFGGRKSWT